MVAEKLCLAHFSRDQDNLVTTDMSRIGLGMILWQKQSDNIIRLIAFVRKYLHNAEKIIRPDS